ncbi:PriCT-2 domain-containing protein [Paraburkholderia diazotrophica]|uniref:Putative DNA primase/helicase n=1 Tax=Paraburkholderia diazotrophica TaxID=667676 RepID=A0A1H6TNE7_9BURK|nr:PriCT-2 domain-containing protein [Paraburkholderia diazotrophica]SEI81531.1 putative DNA primase/helicase [Paraburkholderia diazotrophica]
MNEAPQAIVERPQRPFAPATLEEARDALIYVSPDCDRNEWFGIGAALYNEFGDAAFDLFDSWSQGVVDPDRYDHHGTRATWRSIKGTSSSNPKTFATIARLARDGGWSPQISGEVPSAEELIRRNHDRAKRQAAEALKAAERQAKVAEYAKRQWGDARECGVDGHPYLVFKRITPCGARVGTWARRDPTTGEVRTIENALLIRIRDAAGETRMLQAIFDGSDNFLGRSKDFSPGGQLRGNFFTIGQPKSVEGRPVVLICEGFATAASLHVATKHAVVGALSAGNLEPVAAALRTMDKLREAILVFCADNDRWTAGNPGLKSARAAAAAFHGKLAVPQFDASHDDRRPTDFNDLAVLEGVDAVREAIEQASAPAVDEDDAELEAPWAQWAVAKTQEVLGRAQSAANVAMEAEASAEVDAAQADDADESREHGFRVLGHGLDGVTIHVFSHSSLTIVKLNASTINEGHLMSLYPNINWWERHFPNGREKGIDKRSAIAFLAGTAFKRGVFDPSNVRGRGAWIDDGRVVFHHGDTLSVNGVDTPVSQITSRYTYPRNMALPRPADEALSDEDGKRIFNIAKRFRWTTPGSAALLAGFVMLAPLCGALRWRPHVWLTGGAGCGKSTVLNEFVHPLMNGSDLFAQGNSSEAGFRQTLRTDARPVLFDESESNEEGDIRRIQNVLSLIRQASTESEARTLKGTAGGESMSFHIRSMFCLASIQVGIKHQADVERLAVLAMRPKRDGETDTAESWKALKEDLYLIKRDPTIAARLMRRALTLLPVIQKNIEVFAEVAATRFGSQRDGDQYGTLLAGAWALLTHEPVTRSDAEQMIDGFEWSERFEDRDPGHVDDTTLSTFFGRSVDVDVGARATLYELVRIVHGRMDDDCLVRISKQQAKAALNRYGVNADLDPGVVYIGTGEFPDRDKALKGTTLETGFAGRLEQIPGNFLPRGASKKTGAPVRIKKSFGSMNSRHCIGFPLDMIITD